MRRRKAERSHYVLKGGRVIGEARERSMERMIAFILPRSIIAGKTPSMGRMGAARTGSRPLVVAWPDERKPLYGIANKRKKGAKKTHTMKEAVECLG
jgi:hypothetical protein